MIATRAAAGTTIALGLAGLSCREPVVPNFVPPAIQATAVVTGLVRAPNGHPLPAQLVYVASDFSTTCGPGGQFLGLVRTDGDGVYLFNRVVAPEEVADACVMVIVRPEARTGLAEARLTGTVDFRLLPPADTVFLDVLLTP